MAELVPQLAELQVENGPQQKRSKGAKGSKAVAKLQAKQARRRMKTDQLPDPSLGLSIDEYTAFASHLRTSRRILALLGAGLSAASGIPTFRGPGGFWRKHDATQLATPEAFYNNPSMVWQFYHDRRVMALHAKPNMGHLALAELARRRGPDFLAITQNIDGLSERVGHAEASIQRIHGSLHEVRCTGKACTYRKTLGPDEELCPSLPIDAARANLDDIEKTELVEIAREDLPRCPDCGEMLRPAVVWFGEPVQEEARDRLHEWLDEVAQVDLMLVVGTSAVVFPAAAYIHAARVQGARIAVFNIDEPSEEDQENPVTRLRDGKDWFFQGSAAEVLPEVLKEAIGTVTEARLSKS